MDAITLLKKDHETVEKLFKRFEKTGDGALVERRKIVDRIIEELSVHAVIEEQLFYPVTRATVEDTDDVVLESLEEHHVVKWLLDELETMDPANERFKAKVTVLIENVRHHVEEEEGEYFPKVRAELGRNDLNELGDAMQDAKKSAPTHPHPKAPDTPPGNIVAGAASGVMDRVTDTVGGLAMGGVGAAQDLVARFTGGSKPRPTTSGTSASRKTASKVRSTVSDATEKASRTGKATVDAATQGAKRTASAAKGASTSTGRAAKKTATTAKSSTKRTASTARGAAKKTATTAKRAAS
jgi:hemerythrin superfamily protein